MRGEHVFSVPVAKKEGSSVAVQGKYSEADEEKFKDAKVAKCKLF